MAWCHDNEPMTDTNRPHLADASPARHAATRSRITNGTDLLPDVDRRSPWARYFRDVFEAMADHVGGADRQSEPERMTARRIAALEAELAAMESRFAQLRELGESPTPTDLDLYSRLANGQRRHLEAIGMQRRVRDVTPDLTSYLQAKRA